MAANAGTLETIARAIANALEPLANLLSPDTVTTLFAELGLQFPANLLQPAFQTAIGNSAAAAGALSPLITDLATAIDAGDDASIVKAGAKLVEQIGKTIDSFTQVATELNNLAGAFPGISSAEVSAFATSLPTKLLGYLLISYLEEQQPPIVGAGNLLGFMDYIPNPGIPGDAAHPPYVLRQLQLSKLTSVLSNPSDALKTLYGWGAPTFDGKQLVERVNSSLDLFGIPSQMDTPTSLKTGLFTLQATPPGLTAALTDDVTSNFDLTLPLTGAWSLVIHMQGDFKAGITAAITPPANVALHSTAVLNGQLQTSVTAKGPDAAHPFIVFGQSGGSRIQADSISFGVGVNVTADAVAGSADAEPQITAQITGGKVIIDTTNADGFLKTILGSVHVEADFDLKVTWAPDTGVHFVGGAQFEIDLPLHLNLGPVTLPTLYLVAGVNSDGIPLEVSVALGIALGPISASADRVGVNGLLSFPDHGGNLGPVDLSLNFKPPSGLGIGIDAGVIAGGGFLSFDPTKGQYAGVLDAALLDVVQIKIIGVLDTTMPDGSKGFAFLLIITFDFPPIQLSFGFTLTGVGGLIGVNRTMSKDALHAGFRAHTLNSVLFPNDPIKNAPQIISNIRSFFPPADNRYLFGPMLQLGWGTPTLITLSLGVILEVPDPIRILILGLIDAGLPTADAALIEIHIDILGLVDFAAKTLSIDGAMYDSHVLIYSMQGDLALRLFWGDNPNFLFSLGGVNPHFNTAGLDLPDMKRCLVSIGDGDNPRISANNYFAITSNSVQFGANVEAYASAGGFAIHGYLGFDLIIIFSPFSFEFDFSAGFDVSFEGATLLGLNVHGTLSGPRPWHVHGDAEIDLFLFSVSASVDLTWGDSAPVTLPQKSVLEDLVPALQDPRNWSAALPDGTTQAVSFVSPKPDDKTLLVHPIGTLTVREKVVPLDLVITRYGNAAPSDGTFFAVSKAIINAQEESRQPIQDYFAAGQYLTLSDADKISHPSFQLFDTGVTIGSTGIVSGSDSPRTVTYDERYIDVKNGLSLRRSLYAMPINIHSALVGWGAGFTSPLKNTGLSKYQGMKQGPAITTEDPNYVIAGVDDLAVRADILARTDATYFQARAALNMHLASHPEDAENLQIIPAHEVAA